MLRITGIEIRGAKLEIEIDETRGLGKIVFEVLREFERARGARDRAAKPAGVVEEERERITQVAFLLRIEQYDSLLQCCIVSGDDIDIPVRMRSCFDLFG